MAGTPKGKIDCYFNAGGAENNTKDIFVALYKFLLDLETAGYVERIALQWGASGTGMDYSGGAAPPGRNAFYVFRFKPSGARTWSWYLLVQWSYTTNFGVAPGDPGLNDGSTTTGIAIAAAVALTAGGADANPWKGDTDEDGTDIKGPGAGGPGGAFVWDAPALGTVYVWPRSNGTGGSHTAARQNCAQILNYSGADAIRAHFMADEDNLGIFLDTSDDGTTYSFAFCGVYTPLTGLTPPVPFAMISSASFVDNVSSFGPTAGGAPNGGVLSAKDNTVRSGLYSTRISDELTTMEPSNQYAAATYIEHRLPLYCSEAGHTGQVGFIDPFIRQLYNATTLTTLATKARILIGTATTADGKISLPWDGVTVPKTGVTRDGVSF